MEIFVKELLYRVFATISLILLILAALTVMPWSGASTPSMLGYRALCSASPISTFLLVVFAGGVYVWANYAFRGKKIL